MAHARGRCFDILHWFFTEYEIFDKETIETTGFKEVAIEYLLHQATVILTYKKESLKALKPLKGKEICENESDRCTLELLKSQLSLCFEKLEEIPTVNSLSIKDDDLSLAFPNRERYDVRKLEESRLHLMHASFLMTLTIKYLLTLITYLPSSPINVPAILRECVRKLNRRGGI